MRSPHGCERKEKHKSRGKAEAALRAYHVRFPDDPDGAEVHIYYCNRCGHYHLGHRFGTSTRRKDEARSNLGYA